MTNTLLEVRSGLRLAPVDTRCRHGFMLLMLLGGASVAHAQVGNATLDVCNQGTIAVNLFSAKEYHGLFSTELQVYGWTHIEPGTCQRVYWAHGEAASVGEGVYLGLATIERGEISGFYVDRAPDLGEDGEFWDGFTKFHVLAESHRQFCASLNGMNYAIDSNATLHCSTFHSDNTGDAPYVWLASALYFQPRLAGLCGQACPNDGKYFLRVAPRPNDYELHASAGTGAGVPVAPSQRDEPARSEPAETGRPALIPAPAGGETAPMKHHLIPPPPAAPAGGETAPIKHHLIPPPGAPTGGETAPMKHHLIPPPGTPTGGETAPSKPHLIPPPTASATAPTHAKAPLRDRFLVGLAARSVRTAVSGDRHMYTQIVHAPT